jgi:hypothetical protein
MCESVVSMVDAFFIPVQKGAMTCDRAYVSALVSHQQAVLLPRASNESGN